MAIVSSFLIVGLIALVVALLLTFSMGTEGLWRKVTEIYLAIYIYILFNYLVCLFSKNPVIAAISLFVSGIPFASVISRIFWRWVQSKKQGQNERWTQWKCLGCGTLNQHSHRCWNCNTEKVLA
ncbi:MAG: hypothetical protein HYS08_01790 [Chlamydiae bacterium]|nr:hypothetical protein [Chlamydiota bacterium]